MPYADPEKQKAAKAKWYREKRASDPAFALREEERVKAWKEENREVHLEQMREYARRRYEEEVKATAKPKRAKKKAVADPRVKGAEPLKLIKTGSRHVA
ncbi:hypothetical protein [Prosthecobacter dejongeii]|uniref:Acyl-coenzyme A thioesterase PaaI-like protein n=1 Tax=Prosthecobacter dejongeii TaxID=48465 RepID=A0A7W7YGQ1_9BACT|nr:hypothetical protein [Prosthecobacter dejongeii]MBB5035804.1 acyl-coenzyme A thioesterase PaaI-like protein [Prosthecobacter dejongeii]